jgi:hypothetical protein
MQGFSYADSHATIQTIANHEHFNLFEKLSDVVYGTFFGIGTGLRHGADHIMNKFDWWINAKEHLQQIKDFVGANKSKDSNPLKALLITIFSLLEKIIYTPTFMFSNDYFMGTLQKFSVLSMGLVTSIVMVEGIKKMFNKSKDSYREILQKFPLVLATVGFAPMLITQSMKLLGNLTSFIQTIGIALIENKNEINISVGSFANGTVETVIYGAFVVLFAYTIVPILLQHGRRYFTLLTLTMLTPLAMLGYMFKSLSHWHSKWWNALKNNFLSQLYFTGFVSILNVVMFGFSPTNIQGVFSHLLIVLGGIHMFAHPPGFVSQYLSGSRPDVVSSYKQMKNTINRNPLAPFVKKFTPSFKAKPKKNTDENTRMGRWH